MNKNIGFLICLINMVCKFQKYLNKEIIIF
jgi:hypothetical protein